MRRFPICAALVLGLSVVSSGFAQNVGVIVPGTGQAGAQRPGPPPRDRAGAPQTGTAALRGRVVSADGTPLRRAQVSLLRTEMPLQRSTTSDAEGRYEFAELPAGRYTVSVNKAGFVQSQYGQRRPFEPGTPIVVTDGQTLSGIDVMLPKGGVIAGRITDEFGEPIAGAQAQAQRYQYGADGQRRLATFNMATSDDLGQFRIYGMMPGEYVVSASARGMFNSAAAVTSTDVNEGFAPTFYPGTPNANEAEVLNVNAGQETSVQFALLPSRLTRISGVVTNSAGRPVAGAMVSVRSGTATTMMFMGGSAPTGADGSFSLAGVAPGEYVVDVREQPRAGTDPEFASVPITVGGSHLTGLRITTGKGVTITGRVVFEGNSPRTAATPGQNRVFAQQVEPTRFIPGVGGNPLSNGTIADDGTFELASGFGQVFFRVGMPPGWTLKSVTLEGEDITDEPFDLTGKESVSGLRIVVTDRLTNISGQVTDARGQPIKDYVVILQPAERAQGPVPSRFLRTLRGDQDGRFNVRGMPPGRYVATAVETLEQGRHFVPEVQDALRKAGRSFSIAEGATAVVDLRLTPGF